MPLLRKLKVLAVGVAGVYAWQVAAAPVLAHHGGSAPAAAAPSGPVTRNSNEALANRMAAAYGWTGAQVTCLDELWTHESGFDAYAANSASDARGIPQKITGWSAGYQPGNAGQQVAWGLAYIKSRYGTPCAAWDFEMSHTPNWY